MNRLLIRNGTLLDCTGRDPMSGAAVLIEDNRILAAGSENEVGVDAGEYYEIDAQGGMILPGFIDTHVHLMFEGYDLEKQLMTPFSFNFYQAIEYFRRTVEAGITCVRDAGGLDLGTRKAIDEGLVLGPRVKISVNALSITGGHGDSWMPSGIDPNLFSAYAGMPDGRCDGAAEVRKKVREMLRAGAEIIKICSTGGVLSPTDRPEHTQFSPEELAVIVEEASFHGGTKVMSHAQGAHGIKQAVRAGIHSIEHGLYLDDEAIEMMVEKGTYLVPTLLAPISILEKFRDGGHVPAHVLVKAREAAERHKESIARAYRAKVKIAMGTDAGVMPHGSNLRELGLMCEIGMTPMEAILATTKHAAECLEWQDRLGTLEAGKLADIVVWKCDPLVDIHALESKDNAVMVMKNGKVIKDNLMEPNRMEMV
jgi:imidazolonepropionase-like amidohydrolase